MPLPTVFQKLKNNSLVDTTKVVPDHDLAQVIGCLIVKYDNQACGYQWEGELSEIRYTKYTHPGR